MFCSGGGVGEQGEVRSLICGLYGLVTYLTSFLSAIQEVFAFRLS